MNARHYLLFIVVLILLLILRLIQISFNYGSVGAQTVHILIKENAKLCLFDTNIYQILLPNCQAYDVGGRYSLTVTSDITSKEAKLLKEKGISSISAISDKHFKNKKRLIATSVTTYIYSILSPKDWFLYIEQKIYTWVLLIRTKIYQNIPSVSAWLVVNSVLGYIAPIPPLHDSTLDILGLQHIIAVSGFHISFLMMLLHNLLPRAFNRNVRLSIIVGFVCCFWMAVGFQPSVNRAVLMGIVALISKEYFFLQVRYIRLLILAGYFWILIEPFTLLSVSFQLSYLATLGIILFSNEENIAAALETSNPISAEKSAFRNIVIDSLKVSCIAQVYTVGVLWYYFQQYPLLSLLANALIFWLPPLLILIGIGAFALCLLLLQPFVPLQIIGNLGLHTMITIPADSVAWLLLLGNTFQRTLLTLPKLDSSHYYLMLLGLCCLSFYRYHTLTRFRYKPIIISEITRHV